MFDPAALEHLRDVPSDVVGTDEAGQFAVLERDESGDVVLEHRLDGVQNRRADVDRHDLGRHELLERSFRRVGPLPEQSHEVAAGYDTDDGPLVDDHQRSDRTFVTGRGAVGCRRLRRCRLDRTAHHVRNADREHHESVVDGYPVKSW